MSDGHEPAEPDQQPTPSPWAAPSGPARERPAAARQEPEAETPAPAAPAAAPPPAGPPRKGLGVGAILAIVGGAFVLLLVIGVVAAVTLVNASSPSAARGTGSGSAGPALDARDTVRAYLAAVAKGDAAGARKYLSTPPPSDTLLSDAVLARSRQLGAISGVRVGTPRKRTSYGVDVPVDYRIGTKAVSTTFGLYHDTEDGTYSLTEGLVRVYPTYLKGLDLTVNGVTVQVGDESLQLFPGAYRMALASTSLTLPGDGAVVLAGPGDDSSDDALKPKVSDAGTATVRKLVKAAVATCLKQKTLKAGCGLTLQKRTSDGGSIRDGTLTRTSTPELKAKLAHLTAEPDFDTPTLVSADVNESVDVTGEGTDSSGRSGRFKLVFGPSVGTAYVDLSEEHPTVGWR